MKSASETCRPSLGRRMIRHVCLFLTYSSIGAISVAMVALVVLLASKDDLGPWHKAELGGEFSADSRIDTLNDYYSLERRLFEELDEQVHSRTGTSAPFELNRYRRGSPSSPDRWVRDWNRSYELEQSQPRAVVLLLHGLSDSPYSLRAPAMTLHAAGAHVVGLRIPGHGTAPSALIDTTWQDMAAAVDLAITDLDRRFPDLPLHVIGYSNGGALALNHVFHAIETSGTRVPDRVVLISPSIAVTQAASLAIWQARLGRWLGLEKLAWNDVQPEYNPFKYNSFPVNAAHTAHRLTLELQEQLNRISDAGHLEQVPSILAFSSLVDATVRAPEIITRLFNRLPSRGHELVLFDINRHAGMASLLKQQPDDWKDAIDQSFHERHRLTVVTNVSNSTPFVEAREYGPVGLISRPSLQLSWPSGVYALSHGALPFPEDDSLYGGAPAPSSPGIQLGTMVLRGERGVLRISDSSLLRQRWNPFYSYLEQRILVFLGLSP